MALMVLVLVGLTFGWLASVLARAEAARHIVTQIGLALVASLVAGLYANNLTAMGGISLSALGIGCASAVVALAVYNLALRPSAEKA